MKLVYIMLVLVIAASTLGCVGRKATESTAVPPGISENGDTGIESDLMQIDSMMNESAMDISLPEVNADAFT